VQEADGRFELPVLPDDLRQLVLDALACAVFLRALEILPIPVKDPPGSRADLPTDPATRDADAMENKREDLARRVEAMLTEDLVERFSELAHHIR